MGTAFVEGRIFVGGGRAVKYGDQVFHSLSGAAKGVTGHSTNGWVFWRPAETGEQ